MQFRLLQNLGTDDARKCNDLDSSLDLKPESLAAGTVISLGKKSVEYLTQKRGLTGLLAEPSEVRGVAKAAEVKGVK